MADTIREGIISEVVTGLTNFASFVALDDPSIHRGVIFFDPNDDPPPLIAILPRPESSEQMLYGADLKTMQIDFSALVPIGDANPSELGESVLGELIAAVFAADPTNVQNMIYRSGGVDEYPEGKGADVMTVGITVDFVYGTEIGDPYTAK